MDQPPRISDPEHTEWDEYQPKRVPPSGTLKRSYYGRPRPTTTAEKEGTMTTTTTQTVPTFLNAMLSALRLPGEKAVDFGRQVMGLSPEDKVYYATKLRKAGYPCQDPPAPKTAEA